MTDRFRAVLFDWRGTLFHDESDTEWIRASAASIGRGLSTDEAQALANSLAAAAVPRSFRRAPPPTAQLSYTARRYCSSSVWPASTTSSRWPSASATAMWMQRCRIPTRLQCSAI